jgi:putative chitinase
MDRQEFFDYVRHALFGDKLKASQAKGIEKVLDYRDEKWPKMSDDELAYVLATIKHETADTMQPITEYGSSAYLRSKPYWPWIGRGLVQITWKRNYERFGIKKPEKALEWPVALDICFRGMIAGIFTGKKLSDFINAQNVDYVGARRIVNGTDKAELIAGYARKFRDGLRLLEGK